MTPANAPIKLLEHLDDTPLQKVAGVMACGLEHHKIGCVNWPSVAAYCPDASFCIARSREALYLHFMVSGQDLRAENTANLSPVAEDSCVEFFMQVPSSDEYWNFEFNCIGTVNASHRVERPSAVRLTDEQIATIGRHSSLGNRPILLQSGEHQWTLTVRIPYALVGINPAHLPTHLKANVNKCAGKTPHRHYLSWSPINTPAPDFHVPDAFASMPFQ